MHDTCGAAANLGLVNVSPAIKGDLWHVRLLSKWSKFPFQFTDLVSNFYDTSLQLLYGHKSESIPRVLVADGIKVLPNL